MGAHFGTCTYFCLNFWFYANSEEVVIQNYIQESATFIIAIANSRVTILRICIRSKLWKVPERSQGRGWGEFCLNLGKYGNFDNFTHRTVYRKSSLSIPLQDFFDNILTFFETYCLETL